jgi:phospholipase/carboxylesterase
VLLHGRGSQERDILALTDHLPVGPTSVSVRAPTGENGAYAWFANRGIGRPVARVAVRHHGLVPRLARRRRAHGTTGRPDRLQRRRSIRRWTGARRPGPIAGAAILYGTLPFDAGLPIRPPAWPACPSSWFRASTTQQATVTA